MNSFFAFYYPLGSGYVFVTSMYEERASTNWQSTAEGRVFIRDLITRAKKPSALPTYNLSENPPPNCIIEYRDKEFYRKTRGKTKILWLNPDKNLDINLNLTENICLNILNYSGELNVSKKEEGMSLKIMINFSIDRINSKIGGRNEI